MVYHRNLLILFSFTLLQSFALLQSVNAAALNDTGITGFANGSTAPTLTTEPTDYPGQDASFGRDAAANAGTLTKIGGGQAGFDFTKIANNGSALSASVSLGSAATDWACTRDNVTGLIWEVKTDDNGLRDKDWTYSWYDSNTATNGGNSGSADGGDNCYNSSRCDTEKYVADVNAVDLCGYKDWRLPTKKELVSIINYQNYVLAIDSVYFPYTMVSYYWSSSAHADSSSNAWYVDFAHGYAYYFNKSSSYGVRLVRGGQ